MEINKQGESLKEYSKELPNKTRSLRIGQEVPEGDVNLAYIHTPKLQSDENISLIDTSYTSDNIIPQDQMESVVVANNQGRLEYVDFLGNDQVHMRPPNDTFPSSKISITNLFKKNEIQTKNALYYKFELAYHYDSKTAIPDEEGKYHREKYTGQQIEITDENGNLLDDTFKYDIYVTPTRNERIYFVEIYLHMNTNKIDTFKVRYNHIDQVVMDPSVQFVQKSIEFYTNKDNTITVDNKSKQMLEGGKLRIINATSAFREASMSDVQEAMGSNAGLEIYAITPKENGGGYTITVPQRSESDPRIPRIFTHRLMATYTGEDGQEIKVCAGHITDWCINSEALLESEKSDYSGEWKNIGIPSGGSKLRAKDMIEISLPFGTPSIPSKATFSIEDDNGNLLYHVTNMNDNLNVESHVNEKMANTLEAKAEHLEQQPWENAKQVNTVLLSNPIAHRCSIIPERQTTKWDFTWKANGQGYTESKTDYETEWKVCAQVGMRKTIEPKTLDLLDKTKWATIGNDSDVNKWKYSYVSELGKNVIEYLENADDIMGFYQKQEIIDGQLTNLMNKKDYQFSTTVRLTDPVDDDMIGIIFRLRDSKNYYMFAWEKDQLATTNLTYTFDHGEGIVGVQNGCGRIMLDEHGYGTKHLDPNGTTEETLVWTKEKSKYLNEWGFKNNHKKILKATPSSKSSASTTNMYNWDGSSRYPKDKTGCSFTDVTDYSSSYSPKGWEYGKDYKITVVVTGSLYRIYINEAIGSDDLGQLVCQGTDSTHSYGTYGIFCASQRWTYWYDLKMTEIELETVCSENKSVTFSNADKKKLSNLKAKDLLKPLIENKAEADFNGANYEVFGYSGEATGDAIITVNGQDGFIYGQTDNPVAGGVEQTPWRTEDISGTGSVEYHADGHLTVITNPSQLPTSSIPSEVLGFQWNEPTLLSGNHIAISLDAPDKIKVKATIPPITRIGTPYALEESEILKADGIKKLQDVFGDNGFYHLLNIPTDIPMDEILLRIERGKVNSVSSAGVASVTNPEYRVNYRFRCERDGFARYPVDQFQNQIGVNRLRLKSLMTEGKRDESIGVDVVAWTTFEELESLPLFAVKVEEDRKIQIEKPKIEQKNMEIENWYLRIKNGKFLKRIILPYYEVNSGEKVPEIYIAYPELLGMVKEPNEVVEVDLEYSLPEYENQEFHNNPYIVVDKESPVIINQYTIQTKHAPIVLESKTGESFIDVYSIRSNQRRSLRVADIDVLKGIIYLHDQIREQDEVHVRYAYKEDWYTYRGFESKNDFFHLDLNPSPGHRYTVGTDSFKNWIPIDSSKESYTAIDISTEELLVKQINVYLRPRIIRRVDKTKLDGYGNPVSGTAKQQVIFHTDEDFWFNEKDYRYDPTMLRLGKVMLQANSNIKDHMTILDTRTRGGGLDESLSREIIQSINKESLYHWDIGYFDGMAYQENGVIIVKVPSNILKSESNPDGFHPSHVEAAVAKHKAYGVLPIIEYYEPNKSEEQLNVLPNPEFLNFEHIGYYDESRSSGNYEIVHSTYGAGDNYVLKVIDNAKYAITMPGFVFNNNQYRIDVKAKKELGGNERSAAIVDVHYENGEMKRIEFSNINQSQWMIYKNYMKLDKNVHHVTITLNPGNLTGNSVIHYDYVMVIPTLIVNDETTEFIEF